MHTPKPASSRPLYFDYNASTPVAEEVLQVMRPFLGEGQANASSRHRPGRTAADALALARAQIAAFLGAEAEEIVFTSGGTESNNMVIKGLAFQAGDRRRHLITSVIEHPAVLEPCRFLARMGYEITLLPVDRFGWVDPDEVRRALRSDTLLVSIMHANNEVGTLQPIEEIAAITREAGVPFHTDAAQTCGKVEVRVESLGADFLSLAGHKMYAPQGVGALYLRSGRGQGKMDKLGNISAPACGNCEETVEFAGRQQRPLATKRLEPLLHGAGHESGRRAGTEAVALIAGLGRAANLVEKWRIHRVDHLLALRERLHQGLLSRLGDCVRLNGHPTLRLPNTLNVSLMGLETSRLFEGLPDLCASAGAACHGGGTHVSPVLAAMGVPADQARCAVRLSLSYMTKQEEVDLAIEWISNAYAMWASR